MNNKTLSIFTVTDLEYGELISISQPTAICEGETEYEDEEGFSNTFTFPAMANPADPNGKVYLVNALAISPRRGAEFERVDVLSSLLISNDRSKTRFAFEIETEFESLNGGHTP